MEHAERGPLMCGIAGILRQDGAAVDGGLLGRMTDVLAHRGPDGRGLHVDGPVGLGHRRLSIIDLSTGAQPMATVDRALWITYNGEVYNYLELRRELEALGQQFQTTSDTEVILLGYQAWGTDVLARLRGMFAFAIWDGRRRQLFAARDRLGIKPLVYAWDGKALRFGSEIKALLEDEAVARDLDWEAARDYFAHLCVPAPRTIFRSIRKLPPASYLLASPDGGEPQVHRYWTLRMAPDRNIGEAEWIARLRALLEDTVRRHMLADVPVGAFLSGGIDSSTVVATMARVSASPVKTFSIGFDEADFDELAFARQVAGRYGTDHFEMVVKPDVMAILPRLAWQFDEPFADASALPTYCVSKITREHVTVALSGDGGDEGFVGYRRYAEADTLARQADGPLLGLLRPL
jgi:asparagine synthase (glutamine-hydrolysing)